MNCTKTRALDEVMVVLMVVVKEMKIQRVRHYNRPTLKGENRWLESGGEQEKKHRGVAQLALSLPSPPGRPMCC